MHMLEAIEDEADRQEALKAALWKLTRTYQNLGLHDPRELFRIKQDQPALCDALEAVLLVCDRIDWDVAGRALWRERRNVPSLL